MKKTRLTYIKIVLTIFIIAGMFMPYVHGILPIEVLFENTNDLEVIFALTVPLMVTVPFLLILIFKDVLKDSILNLLKPLFIILYFIVLGDYGYGFFNTYGSWIFDESLEFSISIILSLILLLLSLKYTTAKTENLQNICLAIMTLPIVLYFISFVKYDFEDFNYGAYIITISFLILYIMAIYHIYYERNLKKSNKKVEIV